MKKLDMNIPNEVLGLADIEIISIYLRNETELVIETQSTQDTISCRNCGSECKAHGYDRPMELRHLPILGYKTFIQIKPKRGICEQCEEKPISTTQTLDWHERNARQTKLYQQYLMFKLVNSTVADVSRKEEIHEHTIETIIDKEVATEVDFDSIPFLGVIGIDEISLRKGRQKYVTVITYRYENKVKLLKVLNGRLKADVKVFFNSIPKRLKKTISAVCSDLYDGYIYAAKEVFGHTVFVADRFHVAKQYRKHLVTLRKSELKKLKKRLTPAQYKELKDAISILTKNRDCFTDSERKTLEPLFKCSPKLQLAYRYAHRLTTIFNARYSKQEATDEFRQWIDDVTASEVKCFKTFIVTLNKYMDVITNYFNNRDNSGFVEGFNNRLKALTRRCYGIKHVNRFFQRIKIDTEGLQMFKFCGV